MAEFAAAARFESRRRRNLLRGFKTEVDAVKSATRRVKMEETKCSPQGEQIDWRLIPPSLNQNWFPSFSFPIGFTNSVNQSRGLAEGVCAYGLDVFCEAV